MSCKLIKSIKGTICRNFLPQEGAVTNNNKGEAWWHYEGELSDGRCHFHHSEMLWN